MKKKIDEFIFWLNDDWRMPKTIFLVGFLSLITFGPTVLYSEVMGEEADPNTENMMLTIGAIGFIMVFIYVIRRQKRIKQNGKG